MNTARNHITREIYRKVKKIFFTDKQKKASDYILSQDVQTPKI